MSIWALADLHFSFGVPNKDMAAFGPNWEKWYDQIATHWKELISPDDLVLLPGDISWATHLHEAKSDIDFIAALPGTKVMIKGNHDFWWPSNKKMRDFLPENFHFINNDAFEWNDYAFGGARLWDSDEYSFDPYIAFKENPLAKEKPFASPDEKKAFDRKIFLRDLERLKLSLSQMNPKAKKRIALTHYPPIGPELKPSRASKILEEFKIDICVFGHLHTLKPKSLPMGSARGITYHLTAADYLEFKPLRIC